MGEAERTFGRLCISMYKIVSFHPECPEFRSVLNKNMHVYIAGMLVRNSDPSHITNYRGVIAHNEKELSDILSFSGGSSAHFYLVYKNTAEYNTFLLSKCSENDIRGNEKLPKKCFFGASLFSGDRGNALESQILKEMSDSFETYLRFLTVFDREAVQNPHFSLTKQDYADFKRDFIRSEASPKIIPATFDNIRSDDDSTIM